MSIFSSTSPKWIKRTLILTLSSVVSHIPHALADGPATYIVGNNAHTGSYDRQGPTGEGITNTTISLTGNQTVIFYKSSTLQPSNVSTWVFIVPPTRERQAQILYWKIIFRIQVWSMADINY